MKTRRLPLWAWLAVGVGLVSVATSAIAGPEAAWLGDPAGGAIPSCASHDTVRIEADEHAVLLDAADRERLAASLRERHPMLAREGFAPSEVILWYPRDGSSVYVALSPNPRQPTQMCFTAVLDARQVPMAPVLSQASFVTSPLQ